MARKQKQMQTGVVCVPVVCHCEDLVVDEVGLESGFWAMPMCARAVMAGDDAMDVVVRSWLVDDEILRSRLEKGGAKELGAGDVQGSSICAVVSCEIVHAWYYLNLIWRKKAEKSVRSTSCRYSADNVRVQLNFSSWLSCLKAFKLYNWQVLLPSSPSPRLKGNALRQKHYKVGASLARIGPWTTYSNFIPPTRDIPSNLRQL